MAVAKIIARVGNDEIIQPSSAAMFDNLLHTLSALVSLLYPLLATYNALKTSRTTPLKEWLMYWSVLSVILLAESFVKPVLDQIPLYSTSRLVFILYLLLPESRGHRHLFETYLRPSLDTHEQSIQTVIQCTDRGVQVVGSFCLNVLRNLAHQKSNGQERRT
ncbi:hypothetical protein JX266_013958 [Neoarthrinium moseri]|nr:hypothetical protein JX266_013958 [Neoarthrinium moseri]